MLKALWRLITTLFLLIPFIQWEMNSPDYKGVFTKEKLFEKDISMKIFKASIGSVVWGVTYVYAINYTSVSHATIFANSQTVVIVIYKLLKGHKFSKVGMIGIAFA
eukprot:TRINITY_DN7052_c0_g1_i5.p3 TRINITY_DN7052_c0_g1~~TRINITY_DN7052_c0_g1_i5.p3  ORF type:complete len:106 (+),score=24.39 TRINITY_DN7052_c0_g1_i5:215-532(+)